MPLIDIKSSVRAVGALPGSTPAVFYGLDHEVPALRPVSLLQPRWQEADGRRHEFPLGTAGSRLLFLGGRMTLNLDLAKNALESLQAACPDVVDRSSASIVEITNENIASAIKMVSIEKAMTHNFACFHLAGPAKPHSDGEWVMFMCHVYSFSYVRALVRRWP